MRFLNTHVYSMQVQFEDIDAGGVVHHPRYLLFAERARYAALREIQFGFERQLQEGQTFVLAETMSRYHNPLLMGQSIWVVTRTVACRKSSVKAFQVILSRAPTAKELNEVGDNIFALSEVVFSLQIRFVFVDLTQKKSMEIPECNRQLLSIPAEDFFEKHPERRDVRLRPWGG